MCVVCFGVVSFYVVLFVLLYDYKYPNTNPNKQILFRGFVCVMFHRCIRSMFVFYVAVLLTSMFVFYVVVSLCNLLHFLFVLLCV